MVNSSPEGDGKAEEKPKIKNGNKKDLPENAQEAYDKYEKGE